MARQAPASASRGGKVRRIAFRVAIAAASLLVLFALLFAYPLIVVVLHPAARDILRLPGWDSNRFFFLTFSPDSRYPGLYQP